ncbi:MAG: hypothetical protein ABIZ81_16925 [Opitutaceae bacterium]
MNAFSRRLWFLACSTLCFISTSYSALGAIASYSAARSWLTIDGVPCGFVKQWQGGEALAEVLVESPVGAASPKKHLSAVRYAPIAVKVNFPVPGPLFTLINDFLANGSVQKTVTLTDLNLNNVAVGLPLEAVNASLTEVNFEAFDAAGKDSAFFTLVFSSALVRSGTAAVLPSTLSSATAKNIITSGFTFKLGTLATNQVSQVSAFTAKRRLAGTGTALSPVEFSNLTVTLVEAQAADWKTWADNFIVTGNNGDPQEKTGTLEIRDALLNPVLSLQFSNVGIARLRRNNPEAGSEQLRRLEAELYYERLTASVPLVPLVAVTTMPLGTATAAPAPTAPATTTPATATAPVLTPVTTVDNTAVLAGSSTTAPPTRTGAASGMSIADMGAQDPADFPRLPDFARKTFTSYRRPASSEETATYASRISVDEILAAYERTLKADGWEQTMRNESGDPTSGTHQFRLRWTKALESVEVRLAQARAGGTDVSVAVTSTRTGALPGLKTSASGMNPIAVATGGTTGDLGARDPVDFPRPAGSLRKSYSSAGTATAPQETVAYTAKFPIAQLEAFYVGALSGADWGETSRREQGDPAAGSHQTTVNWSKTRRTAAITLTETGPATTLIEAAVNTSGL